jgi:hypothetical protein
MNEFVIDDLNSLSKAAGYMHDAGFGRESIEYDKTNGILKVTAKKYQYIGKIFQRKTNVVEGEFNLVLSHVKTLDIIERDKKGYQATGEDYFNDIKMKSDKILVIRTAFHEIKLEVEDFLGTFEYSPR